MLKETIQTALNKHINEEIYSSYLYLSMSAYFEDQDLPGMANWMRVQAQEELVHVMKFFDYVNDRDGRVQLGQVAGPPTEWGSSLEAFRAAYEHECKITRLIGALVDLSLKEGDHLTHNLLQWFVTEQVEEEASAKKILGQLKLIGQSGEGLFMIDKDLATRVFVPPPPAA